MGCRSLLGVPQHRGKQARCSALPSQAVGVQGWGRREQCCTIQPQTLQSCQCRCWVGSPQLSASTGAEDMEKELQEREVCPCSKEKLRHSVADSSGRSALAGVWDADEWEDKLLGHWRLLKTPFPGHTMDKAQMAAPQLLPLINSRLRVCVPFPPEPQVSCAL